VPTTEERIELTAVDKFSQVLGQAQAQFKGLGSTVDTLKSAFMALGLTMGVGGMVALIKSSIDAADRLNDLSKSTGITVETLAGLKVAAKQSGGDLDSIAQAVNKLAVNMGKDAEKFKALGVSAKDPLEAFKQLADLFVALRDPQQRAAVMAEALGKSWAGAAPLLAEGGRKIGEMVERGTRLSGVTKEMAEQADAFNDKLTELGGTGGMLTRVMGPALPLMNDLADSMLRGQESAEGFKSSISPLAELLKVLIVVGSDVSFVFQTMGKDFARAAENVRLIALGDFAGSRALGEMFRKDAEAARKALDEYQARIMGLGLTGTPAPTGSERDTAAAGAAAAAAAARAKRFLGPGGSKGKTAADVRAELLGFDSSFLKDFAELNRLYQSGTLTIDEYRAAVVKLMDKQAFAKELDKQREAVLKSFIETAKLAAEQEEKQGEILAQFNQSASERVKQIEFETQMMESQESVLARLVAPRQQALALEVEANAVREKTIEFRRIDLELEKLMVEATPETVEALYERAAAEKARLGAAIDARAVRQQANQATEEAAREWNELWGTVEQTGKAAFVHLLGEGRSAFEGIGKAIKASVIDLLYQLTVRKWIINIGASISGSVVSGMAGAAGSSLGGGTGGIGDLLSLGSSAYSAVTGNSIWGGIGSALGFGGAAALGGGISAAALGGGAAAIGGGALGTGLSIGAGSVAAMGAGALGTGITAGAGAGAAMGAGAAGGLAAGAMAAIPYVGVALMALYALGAFDSGGGPKASDIGLYPSGSGIHFGQNNVTDTAWGEAYDRAFVQRFAALGPKGKEFMMQYSGQMWGASGPASAQSMVSQYIEPLMAQAQAIDQQLLEVEQAQLQQLEQLSEAQPRLEASLANAVRSLPEALGITSLEAARMALATSESVAPLERFAAARSFLEESYGRAAGGDLSAIGAFPEQLQSTLGIGRDVFASGPQFAEIFSEGNRMLNDLLARQREVETELVASVPDTIREASNDQIGELKRGFTALVGEVAGVKSEIQRLQTLLAA